MLVRGEKYIKKELIRVKTDIKERLNLNSNKRKKN